MLGKTVYFLNFKDKKVDEGIIIEAHISTGGYESYLLQTENGDKQIAICGDLAYGASRFVSSHGRHGNAGIL